MFARVRPLSSIYPIATVRPDGISIRLVKPYLGEPDEKREEFSFNFDKAFAPTASQEEVFAEVSEFIQSALDGYSSCVFCYGPSASGKTFSLRGINVDESKGIFPRAMQLMKEQCQVYEDKGWEYSFEVRFN